MLGNLNAQLPTYNPVRYTVDDGLPSNECHSVVTDAKGYVWIATDRGLSRWDGYAFKNYGVSEGLEDVSIYNLYKDTNDDIWIITSSAKLYIYQQRTSKIVPYKHNDLYSFYRRKVKVIKSILINESRKVYLFFHDGNIMSISDDGCVGILSNIKYDVKYDIVDVECRYYINPNKYNKNGNDKTLNSRISIIHEGNKTYGFPMEKLGIKNFSDFNTESKTFLEFFSFPLDTTNSFMYYGGKVFHYQNEKIISSRNCTAIKDMLISKNGEIYTAEIFKSGVKYYRDIESYMSDLYTVVLPNVSASRLVFDGNNGLWITTLEDGVIHARKNIFQQLYLGTNTINRVTEVEVTNDGSIYVVNNDANLIKLNTYRNEQIRLLKVPNEIKDLKVDNEGEQIAVSTTNTIVFSGEEVIPILYKFYFEEGIPAFSGSSKNVVWDERNRVYIIGIFDFYAFDEKFDKLNLPCLNLLKPRKTLFAISAIDDCTYLLGGNDGLELYREEKYNSLSHISPLFSTRVNEIINKDNTYYIATQGQGLLVVDDLLGLKPKVKRYNQSQGILSDNIENITVDERGNIYLSTFAGFNILRPDTILNDYKIKGYTKAHGLPSNEVNDIAVYKDKVYIGTGDGLVLLNDNDDRTTSRAPLIENIQVNDVDYNAEHLPSKLDYFENNLIVAFKTIDLSLNGKILYRYGLDKKNLEETYATSVNYNDLSSGDYTFYVQSMDRDQRWSDFTTVTFAIGRPWWESPYLWAGFLVVVLGLVYAYFRSRLAAIRANNSMSLELIALERSALQAQINPHFIFNCLNSIQNYIMKNDKDIAMEFLNKFAHLIRQTLNLSASSEVTLEEEINVLENYLALEQMRFRDSFTYAINLAPTINSQKIKFPPLLLQPFVENAIIHGTTRANNDAEITINIDQTTTHLIISILDNGNATIQNIQKHNYKSMGMDITRKRLNFVNKYAGEHYTITPRESENGTEVIIKLLLKEVSI